MDSGFGDQSYPKLPPIRKGSVKETSAKTANGNERSNSGFSRETHGLVRLPPIIRVDTTVRSSPEITDTIHVKNQEENLHSSRQADIKTDSHVKLNKNSENHRNEDNDRRGEPTKGKITQAATNNSNEFIKHSHLVHNDSHKVAAHFESNDKGQLFRRESKPVSFLSTNQNDYRTRRGSLIISETEKPLHRGRRLAKSSPDLSSTRKQFGSPITEARKQDKTRIDLESFQGDIHRSSRTQRSRIANKNLAQRQSLKNRWEFPSQPLSSPCSPVVQLMDEPREQQRKSLGDIYSTSYKEPRSFNRMKGSSKDTAMNPLIVEGKTCHQNERLTARVSSPRPSKDNLLRIPHANTKRDSLYDLQQMLSLLNKENKGGLPSDPRRSSTYDLKEFLDMSLSKQETGTENASLHADKAQATGLLTTHQCEQAQDRRGSTYDLLEFLSLNAKAKALELSKHDTKHENVDGSTHFLFPTSDTNTDPEQRRTSAYDLMEFLSLSRQKEQSLKTDLKQLNQPPKLQPPSLVLQPPPPTTDTLTTPTQDESARKGSVYDLQEFLNLTRKNNSTLATKVTEKDTGPQSSPLLSPRRPSRFKFKRESIYDLQEFLGVLQKESELKRTSTNEKEHDIDNTQPDTCINQPQSTDTDSLKPEEHHKNRSLSIYDIREFLSLYSSQSQTNVASHLRRKPSEISQSSIMINVTEDEFGNGCVDDVFLAVPVEGGAGRKRSSISSVAELNELINIINDTTRKKSTSDAPAPLSRHDSGGAKSLLDLGEFLSVLNTDDSPLRRRLSSVSDRGNRSPSSLSRNDSSGGSSLYDLEEFLAVINDSGQLKGESEDNENNEISIAVPQLPPRIDRNEQIDHQV